MTMTRAIAGMIDDMTPAKLSSKLLAADADCGAIVGVSTTGLTFEGIVVGDAFHKTEYKNGETARVLSEGRVWVELDDAAAVGDKVMVTASTGIMSKAAGTTAGTYTLNDSRVIVASASGGGLALIELHGVSLSARGA